MGLYLKCAGILFDVADDFREEARKNQTVVVYDDEKLTFEVKDRAEVQEFLRNGGQFVNYNPETHFVSEMLIKGSKYNAETGLFINNAIKLDGSVAYCDIILHNNLFFRIKTDTYGSMYCGGVRIQTRSRQSVAGGIRAAGWYEGNIVLLVDLNAYMLKINDMEIIEYYGEEFKSSEDDVNLGFGKRPRAMKFRLSEQKYLTVDEYKHDFLLGKADEIEGKDMEDAVEPADTAKMFREMYGFS